MLSYLISFLIFSLPIGMFFIIVTPIYNLLIDFRRIDRTRLYTFRYVLATIFNIQYVIYRVYHKKLNKPKIAHRLCKAPQCTKFFIEIGCLGTDNVV